MNPCWVIIMRFCQYSIEFSGEFMKMFKCCFYGFLIFYCQSAVAEIVAHVTFAKGETYVIHNTGKKIALKKGASLEQGDKIVTQTGNLQVRFTDGGIISFYDNTEFKINDYHFSKKNDGNEKAFFHFSKGVFRTSVGSIKKDRYQIKTNIASISTRGTEYLAKLDNHLQIDVFEGIVILENQAGNFAVSTGYSALIPDISSIPSFIKLKNKSKKSLDKSHHQQPKNQSSIKQKQKSSLSKTNDSSPIKDVPVINNMPQSRNEALPSLNNNLPLDNISLPSRHKELDNHQEKRVKSKNQANITVENILNKTVAKENLSPALTESPALAESFQTVSEQEPMSAILVEPELMTPSLIELPALAEPEFITPSLVEPPPPVVDPELLAPSLVEPPIFVNPE